MKKLENLWPKTEQAERFKFFAEAILEATDEGAWDSYKPDALSTPGKLFEVHSLLKQVKQKSIPKNVVGPALEELQYSIKKDFVATESLRGKGLDVDYFSLKITDPTEKLITQVEILLDLIAKDYFLRCESFFREFCLNSDGREKARLCGIVKSYVSLLTEDRLSQRYIHEVVVEHLCNRDVSRCSKGRLDDLFSALRKDPENYSIFFCAGVNFSEQLERSIGVKVCSSASDIKDVAARSKAAFLFNYRGVKVLEFKVNSRDHHSAVQVFEKVINLGVAAVFLTSGAIKTTYRKSIVVSSANHSRAATLGSRFRQGVPQTLYLRRHDPQVDLFRYIFGQGTDSTTFSRLFRALSAASVSISSYDDEAKIVTLWSAFEALLPEPPSDNEKTVRISHFIALLVPCIVYDHVRTIFEVTYRDYRTQFGEEFSSFVKENGTGETNAEKFCSIVIGVNDKQSDLVALVSSSPLARFRLKQLQDRYSSAKSVLDFMESVSKKIEWQLHRIYRERNSIVHSGSMTPGLEHLVAHAYSYFQSVALLLEKVYRRSEVVSSDHSIELASISFSKRKKQLVELRDNKTAAVEAKTSILRQIIFSEF